MTGKVCGPLFSGLTPAERTAGYSFVTMWPSVDVVAHVDHVRSVRFEPLGPERARLVTEEYEVNRFHQWLLAAMAATS